MIFKVHLLNPISASKKIAFFLCFLIGLSVGAQIDIQIKPESDKLFGNTLQLLSCKHAVEMELYNNQNTAVEFYLIPKIVTASAQTIQFAGQYKPLESVLLAANEKRILKASDVSRIFGNVQWNDIEGAQNLGGYFLPKSNYTFCFEAIEVKSKKQVNSNFPCFWFEVVELERPVITQPTKGVFLTATDSIKITWTSNNKIKEEQYVLEIINLSDLNEPNAEVAFTKYPSEAFMLINSFDGNTFTLDLNQYILEPRKSYGIRVRSIDPQNRYKYKNKGYSEAVKFYF